MNTDLLFKAIELDRRLEAAQDQGLESLARHRWHWTLDPLNTDRVSIADYAARVGRSHPAIARMVNGYASWIERNQVVSLADAIATANTSEERATVIREVAKAAGWSEGHVRSNEGRLVRDVREAAEERAEERGTSVAEEIPHIAARAAAQRKAEQRTRTAKRATKSRRLLAAEGRMATVLKALRELLADAEAEDYTEDEIALLMGLIRQSRAFLGLVEVKLTGDDSGTDWDAELQSLGGQR